MSGLITIYRRRNFRIYDADDGYIVHNTDLDFESHHTHIKNFKTCKYIIDLSIHETIPYHLSDYLLVSLIRLSDNKDYISNINNILEENNKKRRKRLNNGTKSTVKRTTSERSCRRKRNSKVARC